MLDIKLIRHDPERVKKSAQSRGVTVDFDLLLATDQRIRSAQATLDTLRHELKNRSQQKPSPEERAALHELSASIKEGDRELAKDESLRDELIATLPNINDDETPMGTSENDNVVIRTGGDVPTYAFTVRPYYELPTVTPFIKMEQGTRTSGSRFYYLTGPVALLQRAVMDVVSEIIAKHGFERVVPPVLVRERAMFGTGHFPADRNEVYTVNTGEDNLFLVGTSEVPLLSLHDDEIIGAAELPKKYCAETTCFRREAGSYGKDQQGILRVHQFQKMEMLAFADPEQSRALHRTFLAIEEEIVSAFELHYRVVNICTGDLGFPAAQKFDIEAYFPSQMRYRELTSTSNTTDYQTRRLHIRCEQTDGEPTLAHTVNGTAASDRLWLAILEQHQQEDGTVLLPRILRDRLPYESFRSLATGAPHG